MNVVWIEIPFNHENINIPSSWLNKGGTLNPKEINEDIKSRRQQYYIQRLAIKHPRYNTSKPTLVIYPKPNF